MSITKAELERLKARSRHYSTNIQPTPSGVTMQQVDWQIEKQRRDEVKRQEERLQQTGDVLYNNFTYKSTEGAVKAHFNHNTTPSKGQVKEVKPMSEQDNQQPQKSRKPDHTIYRLTGQGSESQWQQVGAMWEANKEGYMTGTVNGERFVMQSRATMEALEEIRQKKHSQNPEQKQSQNPTL